MDNITFFITFALFIEAMVETLKWIFQTGPDGKPLLDWVRIAALVLGVSACTAFNIDLFAAAGFQTNVPYVGAIGTGIILARGANVIHDLIDKLEPDPEPEMNNE
ncbi:MAG TPA: hypothetical protein VFS31_07150 [Chitinophagaceae bacterium]|nr:hypothetical protein [Chitinophagaceae bacterium]